MQFLKGFRKVAELTMHSDGTPFRMLDTEPAPYSAGAAQVAPTGIPTYQPNGGERLKHRKKDLKNTALMVALGKEASSGMGPIDGVGTKSDAADTLTSQLKWDYSGDEIPENFGYNEKNKAVKKFRKGAKHGLSGRI